MTINNTKRPNIIFILIDDMGWKDLACYGSNYYETPNIDSMAKEGMVFTDAYAACPVCSPTRASIMTGKYPATLGLTDWIDHWGTHPCKGKLIDAPYIKHLSLEEKSLAKKLKEGDYQTWHVGKWHLGDKPYTPTNHGFDVNIGGGKQGCPETYFSPYNIENLGNGPDGEFLSDRLTDEAIELIRGRDDNPFFLYMSHYAVHTPIEAKEEDIKYFERKAKEMGIDQVDPFELGKECPAEHMKGEFVRRRILQSDSTYAALIYNLDQNIGRLMETIKDEGIDEETLIIFTSDNGGLSTAAGSPTSNSPLSEGKGWVYDGGVREPLIIRWKGKFGETTCNVPVSSIDFYPTLLELAQIPLGENNKIDGVSIMSLLNGENDLNRECLFWHYPHYGNQGGTPASSVRCGDYKLIEFYEDNHVELYNLKLDISEEKEISLIYPNIAKKLKDRLDEWKETVNAKIPEVNLEKVSDMD